MSTNARPATHQAARRRGFRYLRSALVAVVAALASVMAWADPLPAPDPGAAHEAGVPFIRNFDASEYAGAAQNWAVTQGEDGTIYVGNVEDGVLAFDGSRWSRIPVPNQLVVRALATAPDGRVYVGAVGDFGYLKPDATGRMAYVSLLDKVPANEHGFSDVWSVHATADDVYFTTLTQIFRLHGGRISVVKSQTSFHLGFLVDGTLYILETDRGLMRLSDDRLIPVPGGQRFAKDKIYALLPSHGAGAKPGALLVGTRARGWFQFDGRQWTPWPTEIDAPLDEAALYGATWLDDGRLAVATLRGGLFVLDAHGRLLSHLTRATGLATDVMLAVFQDHQCGLWLATGDGVSRVDVDSPLTSFGESSGLKGAVLDIARHDGKLFVGTTEGLFMLIPSGDGNAHFKQLADAPGQNWSFASVAGQLLVAGNEGVFAVRADGTAQQLLEAHDAQRSWSAQPLLVPRQAPARVFVGYKDGLGVLRWTGSAWMDAGRVPGAQIQADSLAEDAQGNIWMGLYRGGVMRVTLPDDWQGPKDPRTPQTLVFDAGAALPAGKQSVVMIDGQVRFLTSNGIYRFDASRKHFEPDPAFAKLFPNGPRRVVALHQDHAGNLWMYTTDSGAGIKETGYAKRVNGHWQWTVAPLQPLAGLAMNVFRDDADGIVWLGSDKGLFRYDPRHQPDEDEGFHTLIREVSTSGGRLPMTRLPGASLPEIPYAQNALRFEFAAPSYDYANANRFQVLLQGVDRDWSAWSSDAYRDYTNLHEGTYRFRVRARNVYGVQGAEAVFDFQVLPPWYRSWWAWLLWIATCVLVLGLLLRWRSAALKRHNRQLAELVEVRTRELAQANLALKGSNDKLAELSVTDPLTGLKNRRYLYDHIEQDVATVLRDGRDSRRRGEPSDDSHLLFLMVDFDHFKEINDTWGHAAGDRVLQQVPAILGAIVRDADILVRWGGEEFLIVARFAIPEVGPCLAERIRAAVTAHAFDLGEGHTIHCTCSIGFASYPAHDDAAEQISWEQVVNMADECLYAAKRNGRNAWAGLLPIATLPQGDVLEALRSALADAPGADVLPVATSWPRTVPRPA